MSDQNLPQATGDDTSRQVAQSRDIARNDAPMRDASRQGATLRDMSSYTLTVDQAVELMAAGGFPDPSGRSKDFVRSATWNVAVLQRN